MVLFAEKNGATVRDIIGRSATCLTAAGIEQARLEAELILAGVLGGRREDVCIHSDRVLSAGETARCTRWVERRASREPLAYILGRREFWSLDFKVTPDVLVPRPETELLIERLLALVREAPHRPRLNILDLGTGPGILAVVAAREIPHSRVLAVDISPRALAVARANARLHQVADRVEFYAGDLFDGWDAERCRELDFILCNPPYIESAALRQLMPEIRNHEPVIALDGGPGGLDFYRRIIPAAPVRLRPGGSLILEVGQDQARAVADLMAAQQRFEDIVVTRDYSGRDRVVSARRTSLG